MNVFRIHLLNVAAQFKCYITQNTRLWSIGTQSDMQNKNHGGHHEFM